MRMTVDTKQEEFRFGGTRELRGNFIEHTRENENGTITEYECDYFRTKGNETFEQLYARSQIRELKKFLADTDWVDTQLIRTSCLHGENSVEYATLLQKRTDMLMQREAAVLEINTLEKQL